MLDERAVCRGIAGAVDGRQVVRRAAAAGLADQARRAVADLALPLRARPVCAALRTLAIWTKRAVLVDVRQRALAIAVGRAAPLRDAGRLPGRSRTRYLRQMVEDDLARDLGLLDADLVAIRRDLHRHPELGFTEQRTSDVIADRLTTIGLAPRRGIAGTGVVADLAGDRSGPTLLIRADMDGLPVREATSHAFASRSEGIMHACGHDAHVASLLGAATLLADRKACLAGRVRFCFQPAEELLGGAREMISAGVMDGVDLVLAAHVSAPAPFGAVLVRPGPFFAGCDFFELKIVGSAGHGGMPHLSVDPIVAAAHVIAALQTIVSRETRPGETLVVSVSAIEGGRAANVVVEEVTLRGTVRWFSEAERDRVLERIASLAKGVASGLRARAELKVTASAPVTSNAAEPVARVTKATEATGRARVVDAGPLTASEDFSLFLNRAPGCLIGVGAGGPLSAPHHHHAFDIDERAIGLTAELFTRYALDALAVSDRSA